MTLEELRKLVADGEGDHVRNDDEAHGDILQAPDDGDFRGGTDDAEELSLLHREAHIVHRPDLRLPAAVYL